MNELPSTLATALEIALNRYLALDPLTQAKMQSLSPKVIAIELRDINLRFHILPASDKTHVKGSIDQAADTVLSGTSISLLKMGLQENAGDSLLKGEVTISGDVELGASFRAILDSMDIDWEEQLSKLTGDVVAHQVGNLVRDTLQWGKKTADILLQDTSEYLQEESRDLPTRDEVNKFIKQVDQTRMDIDRISARIKRLDTSLSNDK